MRISSEGDTMFKNIFARTPSLQWFAPRNKSRIPGFSVKIVRKEGCVLKSRPKDSPENAPYVDSGVKKHFEVVVSYDGTNSKYQDLKPQTWIFKLTNALSENE